MKKRQFCMDIETRVLKFRRSVVTYGTVQCMVMKLRRVDIETTSVQRVVRRLMK